MARTLIAGAGVGGPGGRPPSPVRPSKYTLDNGGYIRRYLEGISGLMEKPFS